MAKKKQPTTTILLTFSDHAARQGEAMLTIARADLGHIHKFEFNAITFKDKVMQALMSSLNTLENLEQHPPPTELKPESPAQTVDDLDEEGAADQVDNQEPVADPPLASRCQSFCHDCGTLHYTVFGDEETFTTFAKPHQVISACPTCHQPLNQVSVSMDVTLARQAFPLDQLSDAETQAPIPEADDEQIRQAAKMDAESEEKSLNIGWLHQLPDHQARLYLTAYQQALAPAYPPRVESISENPAIHLPAASPNKTVKSQSASTGSAQITMF